MKKLLLLLCVACAAASTVDALEDPRPAVKPPAHIKTDEEIERAIVKGLVANPEVFAADLRVEATDGVVVLFGTVRSKEAKRMAEKIARVAPGVRSVKNWLYVSPPKR